MVLILPTTLETDGSDLARELVETTRRARPRSLPVRLVLGGYTFPRA